MDDFIQIPQIGKIHKQVVVHNLSLIHMYYRRIKMFNDKMYDEYKDKIMDKFPDQETFESYIELQRTCSQEIEISKDSIIQTLRNLFDLYSESESHTLIPTDNETD